MQRERERKRARARERERERKRDGCEALEGSAVAAILLAFKK